MVTASSPEQLHVDGPDPRRWGILAVVIVAQLMIVLDASIVTIALPSAQHALAYLHGQPPVGHHCVHPGFRRLPAAGWPDRRLLGSQAGVRRRAAGLRRRIGARWLGRRPGDALRRPRPAGRVRRTDGTRRPVHPDHHLPARRQGAGAGVRRLRCRLGRRRGDRRPPRRRAHGVRLVALVPARQRAYRRPRLHRGGRHRAREPGFGLHALRRAGSVALDAGSGQPRLRLHQGGERRVERHGDRRAPRSSQSSCSPRSSSSRPRPAIRFCRSGSSATGTGAVRSSPPCSPAPGSSPCSSS